MMEKRCSATTATVPAIEKKCLVEELSDCSTCESSSIVTSSDCSSQGDLSEKESVLNHDEQIVMWEEEALRERLEKEKKRYHETHK